MYIMRCARDEVHGRCAGEKQADSVMVISTKRDATLSICLETLYNAPRLPESGPRAFPPLEIGFRGIEPRGGGTRTVAAGRNVSSPSFIMVTSSIQDLFARVLGRGLTIARYYRERAEESGKSVILRNIELH